MTGTVALTWLVHWKLVHSLLWLRFAWQAPVQPHATVYAKRQQRTPTGVSLTRGNRRIHRSHHLSDSMWVFLLLVFSPCSAVTYVLLPRLCPRGTIWWCSDTQRCLLSTSCHHHFRPPVLRANTPLPAAEGLSSSSACLHVSNEKPQGAMRLRRDSAGDH